MIDSNDFIKYCAQKGSLSYDGIKYSLFFAPLNEFYSGNIKVKTQIRIAMVEKIEYLQIAPLILSELYNEYSNLIS